MLFAIPSHDTLYQALVARDQRFDGQAYVCVSTTGVFCRITCPARKPNAVNCTFFGTIRECIEAGFRACKRCHPLTPAATADPSVSQLLAALDNNPQKRWSEQHIANMGYDLSTVRRAFKRQFGMTFLEMARQRRLREGFESLSEGAKVITAQHDANFSSASAFRRAFAKLLGCPPATLHKKGLLLANWIATPLGDMIAVSSATHLHLLEFVDRKALPMELAKLRKACNDDLGLGSYDPTEQIRVELHAFFAGEKAVFNTPLALQGSSFTREVWQELRTIPVGQIRSYSDIAKRIGHPTAVRAVARANGANQIALVIPCHRVVGADGSLTGYGGGLWRKQRLIEIEQQFGN
ncbi:bifunctional transcriptional activator/DNA repair enzyme AdaA [Agrobacterium bohemicum]|uniref:methylated-DNA--[protein]-cysteine S-methyltransferase n=1 Tax=Agrobacterium bohemicum TaxID=2052828 RepID=A0A135P6G4_9HYPH|nr:trifunctional transcriptional activator/DNA repair protein Ada/methylated-DNA--[protein]-cysteine S-methyltransferase [Agrobacterium bohemicum]KXG87029.1 6-O-methylguanine DNA methyltransferase [Agrobacterium bohemicum]